MCRVCWRKLPHELQLETYNKRKEDPKSVECGEFAARVIATAVKLK